MQNQSVQRTYTATLTFGMARSSSQQADGKRKPRYPGKELRQRNAIPNWYGVRRNSNSHLPIVNDRRRTVAKAGDGDVFYSITNDSIIDNKNTRFPGGESSEGVLNRFKIVDSLLFLDETIVVGRSTLLAVFLGASGMAFIRSADLFPPRGGMATFNMWVGIW